MRHSISRTLANGLLTAMLATTACALTSKADLVDIRYFSPERVKAGINNEAPRRTPQQEALGVKLGRVTSGSNLRERIAYRNDVYELGHYEELRWTERPETYVRRNVARSLFETHGLRRVLIGDAPTLDIEVLAFDDHRLSTGRSARIQLRVILYEDAGVLLEETLTIDRQVEGQDSPIEHVIAAMADALDAASEEVSQKVYRALSTAARSTVEAP